MWEYTINASFLEFSNLCVAKSSIPEGYRILPCYINSVHEEFFLLHFLRFFKLGQKHNLEELPLTYRSRLSLAMIG